MANNKILSYLVGWFVIMFLVAPSTASMEETVKLRVGVPKKEGFPEFVNVIWDEDEHKYNVSGYCMDVFNAVLTFLPFKVSLQIEAYDVNESGQSSNGTYDALVQQIPQKYDVVVGDITILANRSKFVDFTLPYTESGVQMVVAARQGREQSMWTFVKPFSWDLWLSIVVISMFIGSVILIMERNKQVANSQQLSPIYFLWFPISQAVLPEREGVVKKCSRFVLMVWLLLAFVLMQSYTASLTTMMTVEQLQPSFLNVDDLRTGDYYVGYQTGSFVYDLLLHKWKFNPSKLRAYGSVSQYHQALKIGSRGGGVSAIVDELPYLKLFLQKYGSNYMIAGPTYRTAGFGFAFARNSNLTAAFSRGILEVTESDEMDKIEAKYFGKIMNNGWQDQSDASTTTSSSSSPSSLTFYSFSGLFLVTGSATLLALFVSETVIWRTPISMAKAYSRKYLFRTTSSTSAQTHPTTDDDSSSHTTESV
ncbi:glutamate receptor 2.8-like [Arachis stenosperma]|uniref:glutamate receptor 2.8-like n=1 Tax=Arachis stenosperma TaxID=217475 RepID=UPI0025ACC75E|nr:glutamate receptor 2.8-like [Arachis stenosperma]